MLFKSIPEIQEHLSIGNGTEFNRLKPHIQNAEVAYINPLLGASLKKQLQDFFDNGYSGSGDNYPTETMTELLRRVQKSLIHLAYWMGFQVLNATISDSGFKRTESASTKSLFHYQETELKKYFKEAGFNALDEALEYIEEKIDDLDDYDESENWTIFRQSFIPKTSVFNGIVSINNSRLTFLRLKPHMQLIEDIEILPILGSAIYADVKAEMAKLDTAEKVKAILPYIQKPIAYLSSALLMEESAAELTEKGLFFESTRAIDNNNTEHQPASDNRIATLVARNRSIGNAYLDQLKSYLASHTTDWPTYSGSTGSVLRRDNTGKKTFWA